MTKSFVLIALVLGTVLAQTFSTEREKNQEGSLSDDDDDVNPTNEKYPTMDCLLFDESVCTEQCRLKGLLYGITRTNAFCDQNQICQCQPGKLSFYQEWMRRFNADYVYHEILDRKIIADQVKYVFRNPFRTGEQFKPFLRRVLSPYQFSRLKTRDNRSLAAQFTTNSANQPDIEAVRKHVSEQVDKLSASSLESSLNVKYKDKLASILKNSTKETLYNITYRLDQLKNPSLNDILEEHLKENKIEKPKVPIEDKQSLNDVFNTAFVNEIIRRNDLRHH